MGPEAQWRDLPGTGGGQCRDSARVGGICNCGGKLRWSSSVLPCLKDLKSSSQSEGIWLVEAFKTGNERCIKGLVSLAVEPAEVREYDLGLYCLSGSPPLIRY